MPLLFFGTMKSPEGIALTSKRALYRADGQVIPRGSIFDHFRLTHLAPKSQKHCVANFWHLPEEKHCAIAWRENHLAKEQKVFMPGLLTPTDGLELARETFDFLIPSPIFFRLKNLHGSPKIYQGG